MNNNNKNVNTKASMNSAYSMVDKFVTAICGAAMNARYNFNNGDMKVLSGLEQKSSVQPAKSNSEKIEDTLESEESTEKNDDSDESDEPIIDEPISEELSEQEKIDDIVIENENTEQDGSDLSTEIIEENVQDEVEVE